MKNNYIIEITESQGCVILSGSHSMIEDMRLAFVRKVHLPEISVSSMGGKSYLRIASDKPSDLSEDIANVIGLCVIDHVREAWYAR